MATKPTQLCCISIGYMDYLMPMDKGLKLMELMQYAVEVDKRYEDRGYEFLVKEQPRCGIEMVKPSQVKTPDGHVFTPAIPPARKRLTGA
jgi:hypothetical protein